MRGVLAATRGQNDAAKQDFERAFTLNQTYLPIRMAVASSRMAAGDLDGARKLLEPFAARKQAAPLAVLATRRAASHCPVSAPLLSRSIGF